MLQDTDKTSYILTVCTQHLQPLECASQIKGLVYHQLTYNPAIISFARSNDKKIPWTIPKEP